MKWKNKGHEFDGFWNEIKDIESIWLFGAGLNGKLVCQMYKDTIKIEGFLDNDPKKRNTQYEGLRVCDPREVQLNEHTAVVAAVGPEKQQPILAQLREEGKRAYDMHVFFPVYDMYRYGLLTMTSISFLPTTKCNLNCRACLNFKPYLEESVSRDIDALKADVDTLFEKVDRILLFHVSGGEPFLYPRLGELLRYISERYGSRIGKLETTTNGTVVPSNELCEVLSVYQVSTVLDDYRDAVSQYADAFAKTEKKLQDFQIPYRTQHADEWIDLKPLQDEHAHSEKEARAHFEACGVPWQEYRGGKLFLCNYSAFAAVAGLNVVRPGEFFDLRQPFNKYELMEFRLGYSEKGYTEFCKRCAGYFNNPYSVQPAEQMK